MGTQQLLLIVLGVIIVGVAVVVGLSIFGQNATQAEKDAVTQDCLRYAAQLEAQFAKPALLGGWGSTYLNQTWTFEDTENGTYVFTAVDATHATVTGTNKNNSAQTVTVGVVGTAMDGAPVFVGW